MPRRTATRRRGQALLLAVLLMVFAALLGSTFITIVALNLNQTERQGNLSGARASSQAALTFINDKLTFSTEGTRWRPEMVSLPPASGTPAFNQYYTPFERAQGWTNNVNQTPANTDDRNGNGVTYTQAVTNSDAEEIQAEKVLYIDEQLRTDATKFCFVKFPDPRGLPAQVNAPQYLAQLRVLSVTNGASPADEGKIKVDVIGQSEDDPNTFVSRVAYKNGVTQNPIVASARTVTNWDFVNNVVPSARVATYAGTTLQLQNVNGAMPDAPFYLTVGNAGSGTLRSALVTAYDTATKTCTLSLALTPAAVAGERIEVAAALGSPTYIDYGNQGAATAATTARDQVAFRTAENTEVGGVRVNGGLALMGNFVANNINGLTPATRMLVSGLITPRDATEGAVPEPAAPKVAIKALSTDPTTTYNMVSSSNIDFPLVGAVANEAQMIQDGRDRILNNANGNRTVENYVPGLLDRTNESRYRELTQFSRSLVPAKPSAALFGYGEGIYIDNLTDRERISDTTNALRSMTEAELRKMIFDDTVTATAGPVSASQRQAKPYGVNQMTASGAVPSLEQRHLRGWIARDEFRPRGVLIELDPANQKIYITRDDLSDVATPFTPALTGPLDGNDPDAAKVWRDQDGTPLRGVYRRAFDWPKNGTIFADGNVLVRNANTLPGTPARSLTIVSMNNIYIQGSVNAGTTTTTPGPPPVDITRKLLLLAKKNVIANPTALLSHPLGQTIAAPHGATATIAVADPSLFGVGDWVEIKGSADRRVVSTTATTITVDKAYTGNTPIERIIRVSEDPTYTGDATIPGGIPYFANATRLGKFSDSIQRHFQAAPGVTSGRFVMRHSAERKNALQVRAEPGIPAQTYIDFSNKLETAAIPASPTAPTTLIQGNNKKWRVDFGTGTAVTPVPDAGSPEMYPATAPANAGDLAATSPTFRLETVKAAMKATVGRTGPGAIPPYSWYFDQTATQVLNTYGGGTKQPLFFFLAAISNRHSFGYAATEKLYRGTTILSTEAKFPMGTSVQLFANFNAANPVQASTISNTRLDGTTPTESVNQLGFNPQYDGPEDAITGDETFYTKNAAVADPAASAGVSASLDLDKANMTLDARQVTFVAPSTDGNNALALRMNHANVRFAGGVAGDANDTGNSIDDYFDATNAPIPYYRMGGVKIEGPANPYDAAGNYQELAAGMTMDIRAFSYAQEGSWMIVPGGYFDDSISLGVGGPVRVQADGATADNVDLNRDGVISREERVSPFRMRRYNYKVNYIGSIMENHTMPVLKEGSTTIQGTVNDWMDKWAVTKLNVAQTDFNDAAPDGLNTTVQSNLTDPTRNFGNISYTYDPAMANLATATADFGFRPPVSPDLIYTD